jgi:putative zinc finger/helix-turn-helix YgiT family protein
MKHLCSACGSPTRATRGSYHYTESGLNNIILKSVELLHCDACGNEDPVIEGIDAVHEKIAQALVERPGHLDGREFRFLRKHLELTARKLSDVLNVDHATISKWENGKDPIGPQSERLMQFCDRSRP